MKHVELSSFTGLEQGTTRSSTASIPHATHAKMVQSPSHEAAASSADEKGTRWAHSSTALRSK